MEFSDGILSLRPFFSITLGIIVLFVGKRINDAVDFLREFSIPEPVTGGLVFSVIIALVYAASGVEIAFELTARDVLLVYFFTTIGINASIKDLLAGGKPLLILLSVTIAYMFLQNLTGISVAALFDLPAAVGMLGGSVSLTGGPAAVKRMIVSVLPALAGWCALLLPPAGGAWLCHLLN